jgi:hypothetical protein
MVNPHPPPGVIVFVIILRIPESPAGGEDGKLNTYREKSRVR